VAEIVAGGAKKTVPIVPIERWERAMDQAVKGRAAFVAAFESRLGDIYSYFRRLRVDAAAAEDLAQETFVVAWQDLPKLRDERKLRAWLYQIAYHRFLRYKARATAQATTELPEGLAAGPLNDPGSDERLESQAMLEVVRGLPEEYLQPFVLVHWEELSYQEAARVLSLPIGTLAWRVHKALKLLRRALVEKGVGDEIEPLEEQGHQTTGPLG